MLRGLSKRNFELQTALADDKHESAVNRPTYELVVAASGLSPPHQQQAAIASVQRLHGADR